MKEEFDTVQKSFITVDDNKSLKVTTVYKQFNKNENDVSFSDLFFYEPAMLQTSIISIASFNAIGPRNVQIVPRPSAQDCA